MKIWEKKWSQKNQGRRVKEKKRNERIKRQSKDTTVMLENFSDESFSTEEIAGAG